MYSSQNCAETFTNQLLTMASLPIEMPPTKLKAIKKHKKTAIRQSMENFKKNVRYEKFNNNF